MRNKDAADRVRITSLRELDALVGTRLTHEKPHVHWEDSRTNFVFGTVEEALESLQDPYFRQFAPEDLGASAILTEVKEFRRYTRDLSAAWEVVDQLTEQTDALVVRREGSA